MSSWLNGAYPAGLFPTLHKHSKRKNRTVAEAMLNDNWIRDIAHDLTVHLLHEYFLLWDLIEEVGYCALNTESDMLTWTLTTDGQYSASLAYRMQFEGGTPSTYPVKIWKVWAPPRCNFFMWLLAQNKVWTADRLQQRQWPNEYFCQYCFRNLETAGHLFKECPITRSIWTAVASWTSLGDFRPNTWAEKTSIGRSFDEVTPSGTSPIARGTRSLIILVIWSIWRERNNRFFSAQGEDSDTNHS
ncbi:hypothetical protein PR202_gb14240 [Eleusine coracana subsp. coracana]|uniref:Reverse transcriptase zinc-binding domain-containing protein n=1 Tax=Eleusine coracana subsp. coracana TaxID=191504 RepID=A0AAV5EV81_ELECO|nr:hypothetical protein PR202_gb14240 [Eleusine coracana subsp. coracana]